MGCPCKEGRYGAFAIVVSFYWAMQCGGIAEMLHLLTAENGMAIWWAVWTGCGVLLLGQGIIEALSHDDETNGASVLVSVGLIGLALWALAHRWFWLGDEWVAHASRVFWFGLLGSEAFNLWLNFRGKRHAAPAPVAPVVRDDEPRPQGFRLRRRRRVEVVEEIEGNGVWQAGYEQGWHDAVVEFQRQNHVPAVGDDGAAPQIVYVKTKDGAFVPVVLPAADDPVPVRRRLR
jgi:hypothetical protein